jgi:hypothetical protein
MREFIVTLMTVEGLRDFRVNSTTPSTAIFEVLKQEGADTDQVYSVYTLEMIGV